MVSKRLVTGFLAVCGLIGIYKLTNNEPAEGAHPNRVTSSHTDIQGVQSNGQTAALAPENAASNPSLFNPFISCAQVRTDSCKDQETYPAEHMIAFNNKIEQVAYALQEAKATTRHEEKIDHLKRALTLFLDAKYAANDYAQKHKVAPYQGDTSYPAEARDGIKLATQYCDELKSYLTQIGSTIRLSNNSQEKLILAQNAREFIFSASGVLQSFMGSNNASGYNLWIDFSHEVVNNPKDSMPSVNKDRMAQYAGFINYDNLQDTIQKWSSPSVPAAPSLGR